jgi:catechol-2,3-dioxygenase
MFEVQLVVADLPAMTSFYRDRLGLEVSLEDAGRGRVHFGLGGRGQLILARERGEDASPDWPGLPPPLLTSADHRGATPLPHRPVHFAIEIEAHGLVETGERLRAEGVDVRGPFRWPSGRLSIYFRDPEGNVAELISGRPEVAQGLGSGLASK